MSISDLTINQLKRAVAIKEQIERLNKELRVVLGAPVKSRAASKKNRTKAKLSAKLKAYWATKKADKK